MLGSRHRALPALLAGLLAAALMFSLAPWLAPTDAARLRRFFEE